MEALTYRASDIMKEPIIVESSDTIGKCVTRVLNEGIGALIVVDRDKKIQGIVTKRDLILAIAREKKRDEEKIESIMTRNPITVRPDTELREIINIMLSNNISHIPVAENDIPVGIISDRELIEILNDLITMFKAEEIRNYAK